MKKLNSLIRMFNDEETAVQDKYMIGKAIIEQIENQLDEIKNDVLTLEIGTYKNEDCDKQLIIASKNNSTLNDRAIADELTLEELRLTYKASESKLKAIGKGDLAQKYKTVTTTVSATVKAL